ncbi:hypothetical protein FA541_10060 [Pseudomonas aeruginosa]|nr:hypothetical protein [Pseudomonas aeruginosa]RUH63973.1 hypothetical protein IPC482_23705 [Pseudomonas aeruginosa]
MTVESSHSAARRHRTTIYRTAQRLARQAEACSAGIYWTPAEVAAWHPADLDALGVRLAAAGIGAMRIRGELCFCADD